MKHVESLYKDLYKSQNEEERMGIIKEIGNSARFNSSHARKLYVMISTARNELSKNESYYVINNIAFSNYENFKDFILLNSNINKLPKKLRLKFSQMVCEYMHKEYGYYKYLKTITSFNLNKNEISNCLELLLKHELPYTSDYYLLFDFLNENINKIEICYIRKLVNITINFIITHELIDFKNCDQIYKIDYIQYKYIIISEHLINILTCFKECLEEEQIKQIIETLGFLPYSSEYKLINLLTSEQIDYYKACYVLNNI